MAAGASGSCSPALEEQRRKAKRRANVHAGAEMILLGLALSIGYLVLDLMMFSTTTTTEMVLVGAGSLLCIGWGLPP